MIPRNTFVAILGTTILAFPCWALQRPSIPQRPIDLGKFECVYLEQANSSRKFNSLLCNGQLEFESDYLYLNGGGEQNGNTLDCECSRLCYLRFSSLQAINLNRYLSVTASKSWNKTKAWRIPPLNEVPVAAPIEGHDEGRFIPHGKLQSGGVLCLHHYYRSKPAPKNPKKPEGLYRVTENRAELILEAEIKDQPLHSFFVLGHLASDVFFGRMDDKGLLRCWSLNITNISAEPKPRKLCEYQIGAPAYVKSVFIDPLRKELIASFDCFGQKNNAKQKSIRIDLNDLSVKHLVSPKPTDEKNPTPKIRATLASRDRNFTYEGLHLVDVSLINAGSDHNNKSRLPEQNWIEKKEPRSGQVIQIKPPEGYLFSESVHIAPDGRIVAAGINRAALQGILEANENVDSRPVWALLYVDYEQRQASIVDDFPEHFQSRFQTHPVFRWYQWFIQGNMVYFTGILPRGVRNLQGARIGTCGLYRRSLVDK